MNLLDIVVPVRNNPVKCLTMLDALERELKTEHRAKAIIVDDASTDETLSTLKDFVSCKEGRYFLIHNEERRWIGGARNAGVKVSQAKYVTFFDCDDSLAEGALKDICDALDNGEPDMVIWGLKRIEKSGNSEWIPSEVTSKNYADAPCGAPFKAVRRELYVPFKECVYCEDAAWWIRQCDKVDENKVSVINKPIYIYNRDDGGFSSSLNVFKIIPMTLEHLAYTNMLCKGGLNDRVPSDALRSLAELYDLRHEITKPCVKQAWANRFHAVCVNVMTGHWSW